jgi:hypothetical protein
MLQSSIMKEKKMQKITTRTITIEPREVYGNLLYYPECDNAQLFARLCGTKTLRPGDIRLIKLLGYTVQSKQYDLTELGL